jgi:hypothetical protein
VGLNSLKSLNLTNVFPNKKKNKKKNNKNNNKVKSKPLELRSRVIIMITILYYTLPTLGTGEIHFYKELVTSARII